MTCGEMIDYLQQFPPDTEVLWDYENEHENQGPYILLAPLFVEEDA